MIKETIILIRVQYSFITDLVVYRTSLIETLINNTRLDFNNTGYFAFWICAFWPLKVLDDRLAFQEYIS